MKLLWNKIDQLNIKSDQKYKRFICSLTVINGVFGAIAWILIGRLFLPKLEWLLCFIGYPAIFIGLLGGVIYLFNHEF